MHIILCDRIINTPNDEATKCFEIECNSCPVMYLKSPRITYTTQIKLTMESVNHETRNPTPD